MKAIIKNIVEETNWVKSFRFEPENKIVYKPGQWITLTINKQSHDFTLSSNPRESFLQVTTKFRPDSEYKQTLWKLKIGDEIDMSLPNGKFVYDLLDTTPRLFLAGGMGITPFRSMLLSTSGVLLYSVREKTDALFVGELSPIIIESKKEGRINKKIINMYCPDWRKRSVWICGSAAFTDAMIELTSKMGIPSELIHSEDFPGY